ncbi:MAG: hypothetical protein FI685_06280 [SAR202 cluster bacterium]|jgi:hypothetical protein|nr:hypothetical protein [Dehalococcoidia bacterium]MDP7231990.1 hypothetical protein [Dehalococcoidia bacterium]MDP7613451.1 hypothetical protein [Dehalococcoidia bacterium]MQG47684.1 hypothetical protein [SAR202 cluster bacterium]|tara:strand:- start:285 stop:509 length:225 start_codon:yes stop_codon:yes gene_type:complete
MTKFIVITIAGLFLTGCSTTILMEETKTAEVAEVLETPIIKKGSDFQNKIGNNEEHFIGNAEAPITIIVYEDFQ